VVDVSVRRSVENNTSTHVLLGRVYHAFSARTDDLSSACAKTSLRVSHRVLRATNRDVWDAIFTRKIRTTTK